MSKPTIFLDIDGVLNSFDNMRVLYAMRKLDNRFISRDSYGILFDPRCVKWLHYIIMKSNCNIVISSTWRHSGLISMQELWAHRNLPGDVVGITEVCGQIRGDEIKEYVDRNNITNYSIIDDNDDMLESQALHFTQTEGNYGLTSVKAKEIVYVLTN